MPAARVPSAAAWRKRSATSALETPSSSGSSIAWGALYDHLIDLVNALHARPVGFRSLQDSIDTTTPGGKLVFHVFGALAEFERDLVRERTQAGLSAARLRGRKGGRPRAMNETQIAMAPAMLADREKPIAEICAALRISKATLYRYLPALDRP